MAESPVWITLNDNNFEAVVRGLTGLVMVIFWSDSRGACHIMSPVIDRVVTLFGGRIQVGRLNIDHDSQSPSRYGIYTVPTLVFFHQGQIMDQVQGVISTRELTAKVKALLDTIVP